MLGASVVEFCRESLMEQLPKIVRQRLEATQKAEAHPDPDLLAAFSEQSLAPRERGAVIEHLAHCADCRETVALAQPQLELAHVAAAAQAMTARSKWFRGSILRWAAAAACVVVVGTVATLRHREQARVAPFSKVAHSDEVASLALKSLETGAAAGEKPATMQRTVKKTSSAVGPKPKSEVAVEPSPEVIQQRAQAKAMEKRILAAPLMSRPNERTVGAIGGSAGAIEARPQAPPAPPPPSTKTESLRAMAAYQQQKEQRASAQASIANDLGAKLNVPEAAKQNDQVTVALAPPPQTVAKAKPIETKNAPAFVTDGSAQATAQITSRSEQQKSALKNGTSQIAANYISPRWSLSSDGTAVLRSLDAGKTWDMVPIASRTTFRAVAAIGPEIWVGGSGGALYHSSDAGRQWAVVKPVCDGRTLAADIIRIEFPDVLHLQLTISTGSLWTTSDGARTWEEKRK